LKNFKILRMNEVRRELFKLFYKESLFNLNQKADAGEAFACILKVIHAFFVIPP